MPTPPLTIETKLAEPLVLHNPIPLASPTPDASRVRSRPASLQATISHSTASPTVELLEFTAERLSLSASQGDHDLASEIKSLWDEEKRLDIIREEERRIGAGTPVLGEREAGSGLGAGLGLGINDEIRRIWADEKRRSNLSSPVMRYSPVTASSPSFGFGVDESPVLGRKPTRERERSIRSVSSKGSGVVSAGGDTLATVEGPGRGIGEALTRTETGNRSNRSIRSARSVTSPLVPQEYRSPPVEKRGLFITNGNARDSTSTVQENDEEDDVDEFDFKHRNYNRDTITMPKRGTEIDYASAADNVATSRSASTASKNTLQKAGSIFKDFDGAYRSASATSTATSITDEFVDELERGLGLSAPLVSSDPPAAEDDMQPEAPLMTPEERHSTPSGIRGQAQGTRYSQMPPPADGMVFYPAPVPRVLNLPPKLSKRTTNNPARPSLGASRQSVFFNDVRKSALYDSYGPLSRTRTPDSEKEYRSGGSSPERRHTPGSGRTSPVKQQQRMTMKGLPPQLRATMYLDGGNVQRTVEVKNQSAVLTLENMLDESVRVAAPGPLSAPRSGNGSPAAIGARRSPFGRRAFSASPAISPARTGAVEHKSKVNYLPLGKWNERDALKSQNGDAENKENTQEPETASSVNDNDDSRIADSSVAPWTSEVLTTFDRFSVIEEDETESASHVSSPTHPQQPPANTFTAAPNTLLAELIDRKAAQKSRNLTAHDAFPSGAMSATLLELDAAAEAERTRRTKSRTVLAWEVDGTEAGASAPTSPTKNALQLSTGDENTEKADSVGGTMGEEDDETPLGLLPVIPPKSPKRKLQQASGFPPVSASSSAAPAEPIQPLTLLQKRALEENEPLSLRRSRLFGGRGGGIRAVSHASALHHPANEEQESKDDADGPENETLAQRTQRLKELRDLRNYLAESVNLDSATAAAATNAAGAADDATSSFANDVFSSANVAPPQPEVDAHSQQQQAPSTPQQPAVEETLAQRRARLQAMGAQAMPPFNIPPSQAQNPMQPVLRSSPFNTNPQYASSTIRTIQPSGAYVHQQQHDPFTTTNTDTNPYLAQKQVISGNGLLAQSEQERMARRKKMWMTNHNGQGYSARAVSSGAGLGQLGEWVSGAGGNW